MKARKGSLADTIDALDKQTATFEGGTQSNFFGVPPSGKQPENLSSLNQHFNTTLTLADSADAAPTTQARAAHRELQEALGSLRSRWTKLRDEELPKLNAQLKSANLPLVDANQPPATQPSADADGDDEP